MATRLKTIEYGFTALASLTNNTLTNLPQLTIFIPETGTKTFRSAILKISCDDIITASGGNITTKTVNLRLGAAAYTTVNNTGTLSNSGENLSFFIAQDFTSHFQTNWTGTSMTCDVQILLYQTTGTTLGFVNVCATLELTYEYDDASTTHIKTVRIPLNAPTGAIATTATEYTNVYSLDAFLPENSRVLRNAFIVVQGNEARNTATTDHTITLRFNGLSVTTGNYEGSLASDRFFRYVWNLTANLATVIDGGVWNPSASVARLNHFQAWLVVTYEYNDAASTRIFNSLLLPMDIDSPMGGTTAAGAQSAFRSLWIQEPGSIELLDASFYMFFVTTAAISGLNIKTFNRNNHNSANYVSYTDTASVLCGSNALMVKEGAINVSSGYNELGVSIFTSDTADFGWNLSGFWIINYISDRHPDGSGAHNHTVFYNMFQFGTAAAVSRVVSSAMAVMIPENNYFITALGTRLESIMATTTSPGGFAVQVEKLATDNDENQINGWLNCYKDAIQTDPEVGLFSTYSQIRDLFKRFDKDPDKERLDIRVARRWKVDSPAGTSTNVTGWYMLTTILTYHTIVFKIEGTFSGLTNPQTVKVLRTDSNYLFYSPSLDPVGNDAFSFDWFDKTIPVQLVLEDNITGEQILTPKKLPTADHSYTKPSAGGGGSSGPTYYSY